MKRFTLLDVVVLLISWNINNDVTSTYANEYKPIEYPYRFNSVGNPLSPHVSSADPNAVVWDDTVWLYTSHDANLFEHGANEGDNWSYEYMDGYHVYSSTDMINWIDHGEVFNSTSSPWGMSGWMWAPGAARKNDKYYLYYPHKDHEGEWCVGVAIANTPSGPFTDIGNPIKGAVGIDPMVFIDDDGEAYLYLSFALVGKLKPNMIELAEPMRTVDYGHPTNEHAGFEEGSFMHKYKNKYYYSYSHWEENGPTAYYAIGDNPYGPFEWKGPLSGQKHNAPDHHSVIEFKGQHYYFYHMDSTWKHKYDLGWYGHRRVTCFDRMFYNYDGTIQQADTNAVYINAGGDAVLASDGYRYYYDLWYKGGSSGNALSASILGTNDVELYQTIRYGEKFGYNIPLSNGLYKVVFKFVENTFDETGMRIFNVLAEGKHIIENLDVFAAAGGKYIAYEETHNIRVQDHELTIILESVQDNALISALKIERVDFPEFDNYEPCNNNKTTPCHDSGST